MGCANSSDDGETPTKSPQRNQQQTLPVGDTTRSTRPNGQSSGMERDFRLQDHPTVLGEGSGSPCEEPLHLLGIQPTASVGGATGIPTPRAGVFVVEESLEHLENTSECPFAPESLPQMEGDDLEDVTNPFLGDKDHQNSAIFSLVSDIRSDPVDGTPPPPGGAPRPPRLDELTAAAVGGSSPTKSSPYHSSASSSYMKPMQVRLEFTAERQVQATVLCNDRLKTIPSWLKRTETVTADIGEWSLQCSPVTTNSDPSMSGSQSQSHGFSISSGLMSQHPPQIPEVNAPA